MANRTLSEYPLLKPSVRAAAKPSEKDRFDLGLLAYRRNLKAYACSLVRDIELAEDLVQDTLLRALANRDKFDCNTNLRAWLFTILKNLFRTRLRRQKREVELTDGMANCPACAVNGGQEDALQLKQLTTMIGELPRHQMNAVILMGALGFSVEEVAQHENCAHGTVKSRLSRGRSMLAARIG